MRSSAILQLLAETRPGRCPLCDGPLPKVRTRHRKYCGARDCSRLYVQLYSADRKASFRSTHPNQQDRNAP